MCYVSVRVFVCCLYELKDAAATAESNFVNELSTAGKVGKEKANTVFIRNACVLL